LYLASHWLPPVSPSRSMKPDQSPCHLYSTCPRPAIDYPPHAGTSRPMESSASCPDPQSNCLISCIRYSLPGSRSLSASPTIAHPAPHPLPHPKIHCNPPPDYCWGCPHNQISLPQSPTGPCCPN